MLQSGSQMQITEIILNLAVTSIAPQTLVHRDVQLAPQVTSLVVDIVQDKELLLLTTHIGHVRIQTEIGCLK